MITQPELVDEATWDRLSVTAGDWSNTEAEDVDISDCHLINGILSSAQLTKARIRGTTFDRSDLSGLFAEDSTIIRSGLTDTRATGLHLINGRIRDTTFTDCQLDLSAYRFTGLRNVTFRRCRLTEADFTEATLDNVTFVECDLTGASFHHTTVTGGTRFTSTNLTDIDGITHLAGATIDIDALYVVAPALASALGISVKPASDID
ncbi:pentapeptide repeat-containing protein [Natronoglycomyces albus]|uniref:Pentapeptide repeat-containing protein n=1 Tax=Natronoglycomyces albus TaxID=2811108 RepID=A0A895XT32_9ACTN|nr:pentapeptide repeat-containing protein [Natronoglycomyces albus]QSB06812.1 pentapeptide repeat-containing protein [Natronoglycomyces albus]